MDEIPFKASVEGRQPALVRLTGELDVAGAPLLDTVLSGLDGDVELDCSRLEFIDAAGFTAVQKAHDRCRARGSDLILVDPSPAVDRLLVLLELDAVFVVRERREAS